MFRTAIAIAAIVLGMSQGVQAQETAVYPPGADSLVSAITALTSAEEKEIPLWRSTRRLALLRKELVQALIASKGDGAIEGIKFDRAQFVCGIRRDFIQVAAQQSYLSAVTTELQKTATTEKIEGLTKAILSLFKTHSVNITSSPEKLQTAKTKAYEFCTKDFETYAANYYNYKFSDVDVGLEDFLSPFSALVKLFIEIVTPVAEAGAKLVDAEKRKEAIRSYLKKPNVTRDIKAAATIINADLSSKLNAQRYDKLGKLVETAVALNQTKFDLTKEPSCKRSFSADGALILVNQRPSDDFVKCMSVLSASYTESISTTLKAAEDYDQFADAPPDLTGSKLAKITEQLDNIANDKVGKAKVEELWNKAVEIVGFAQVVLKATSKENREKVKQQIDALVKAL